MNCLVLMVVRMIAEVIKQQRCYHREEEGKAPDDLQNLSYDSRLLVGKSQIGSDTKKANLRH